MAIRKVPGNPGSVDYWKRSVIERKLRNEQLGPVSERLKGGAQVAHASIAVYSIVKPLIVGAVILLFIVGPSVIGISGLIGAISWYWWVAFLIAIILFLRR